VILQVAGLVIAEGHKCTVCCTSCSLKLSCLGWLLQKTSEPAGLAVSKAVVFARVDRLRKLGSLGLILKGLCVPSMTSDVDIFGVLHLCGYDLYS
jgi:hypothetical protein